MKNDMSRVLIETIVKKTLKDLKDSPERSIRNLVNMALDFSEGRFRRTFFTAAQTMLENENSPYYDMVMDAAAHVDAERLLAFGMNIGYNSCTVGAKKIREKEAACGFDIPWTVSIQMDKKRLLENPESYDSVISQGEALGIYTWMLYDRGQLLDLLPIMKSHPDSAFVLFCEPVDITLAFLDCMSDVKHLMLAVHYDENAADVYALLRERELLYSAYYVYGEADASYIINGDLFYSTQQLHPLFTMVIAEKACSAQTGERVYQAITRMRKKQIFKTIAWDVNGDHSYIDSIISDNPCSACFDTDGSLEMQQREEASFNLFGQQLEDILRQAFPKQVKN